MTLDIYTDLYESINIITPKIQLRYILNDSCTITKQIFIFILFLYFKLFFMTNLI